MNKRKRFELISVHYGTRCNRNPRCSFCYTKIGSSEKSSEFFLDMVPHLARMTGAVSLGSYGEPLLYPKFLFEFSKKCKEYGLDITLTTNGKELIDQEGNPSYSLMHSLQYFDMVSISVNSELIKNQEDAIRLRKIINLLTRFGIPIGINLLIDETLFTNNRFIKTVKGLYLMGVDNVYCLYPKNIKFKVDITRYRAIYKLLSIKYKTFYIDDVTEKILEEGYEWKTPCHYSRQMISINPAGEVLGCSFDTEPILRLWNPKDILILNTRDSVKRFACPYIQCNEGAGNCADLTGMECDSLGKVKETKNGNKNDKKKH